MNNVTQNIRQKIQAIQSCASELMQANTDLRLALKLAETAIASSERAGAPREEIDGLRRVLVWLRGGGR